MRVDVITLFPELVREVTRVGITSRAVKQGLLELKLWNPRDFTRDKNRRVDDRPYGGGPGMLMQVQPLRDSVHAAKEAAAEPDKKTRTIYVSPQGKPLTQDMLAGFAKCEHLILVAGRYEGVDERFIETEVDEEVSIGDYVISGGELAAMVIIDGITRLLPGALGDEDSADQDSFVDGLLDHPHYTRPEEVAGACVPKVLLSGDHDAIRRWRKKQALGRTWLRRPDLLERLELDEQQQELLQEFIREHEQG
ncbi:MAG: tRNA (guanosine(37)-N1)-methyltransferase TrmD [Gammaproteobacteria bacterium]|nr:MAG: tRNA (guanosine(37)-N1)-methyltransferase TrmD [Gammaproteobacteria bacterium]